MDYGSAYNMVAPGDHAYQTSFQQGMRPGDHSTAFGQVPPDLGARPPQDTYYLGPRPVSSQTQQQAYERATPLRDPYNEFIGGRPPMAVDAPPYLNPVSHTTAPWRDAWPWQQDLDPRSPGAQPMPPPRPPPEGYQKPASTTHPPFYPPRLPQEYSVLHPADRSQYIKNQPSPFLDANIYPVDRPWDQMTDYEKETKVEQDGRDAFFQKLYLDTEDLLAERQFSTIDRHWNHIESQEAFKDYLYGSSGIMGAYKDKYTYLYQKYHLDA